MFHHKILNNLSIQVLMVKKLCGVDNVHNVYVFLVYSNKLKYCVTLHDNETLFNTWKTITGFDKKLKNAEI